MAPVRPAWQPPAITGTPYPARVERWRPLVRLILAEMWDEGRLDGYAARFDDDLVLALIQQESAGSPNATSWVGAIGLMQVMPFTFADMMAGDKALADQIDPADMYDLTSNVRAGLRYLALAMNATEGNLYWALAAYNGGIEAVEAWRAVGLYAVPPIGGYDQTAEYAQIILRTYLAHRPDVKMHVPDPMPYEHLPGAVELLLQAGRY
ncbi:MAG TPA: lytic transglycosylase domain-containing protein [Chloroflexota bacterium]|nr:lytic transglycosylase domain-containing protein [Chloroflexota bacterium]